MAHELEYLRDSDNLVRWRGLYDAKAGAYVNDGTVTVTFFNRAGQQIGSPVSLSYVASSNGNYEGIADEELPVGAGGIYAIVDLAASGDRKGRRRLPVRVVDA